MGKTYLSRAGLITKGVDTKGSGLESSFLITLSSYPPTLDRELPKYIEGI